LRKARNPLERGGKEGETPVKQQNKKNTNQVGKEKRKSNGGRVELLESAAQKGWYTPSKAK